MIPSSPVIQVIDGKLHITWPDPKPEAFLISSELFERMVSLVNHGSDLSSLVR